MRNASAFHLSAERPALDELHDEKADGVLLLKVVEGGDVVMIERGKRARLPLETGQPAGVRRDGLGQHLDGDFPLQPRVAGAVHLAHAAHAEQAEDFKRAKPCARDQTHRYRIPET